MVNTPSITRERRPWWLSPFGGDEPFGDVWSDRLFPVWQRMKGEEWVPTFNFYEADGSYKLEAELPGVKKEDISVTIDNNVLTISGKKVSEVEEKKADYYLKESSYGAFSRSLRLPGPVDEKNVKATIENGVLKLAIPLKKEPAAKQIKIEG